MISQFRRCAHLTLANLLLAAGLLLPGSATAQESVELVQAATTIAAEPAASKEKPPVITALAISPGGKLVATAGDDHVVRVWNAADGKLIKALRGHHDWVRSVLFSASGEQLVSAGDDHQILVWEPLTGKLIRRLPRADGIIYSMAMSTGGQLATVGFEAKARIYDLEQGTLDRVIYGPCGDLRAVAFSPTKNQVAIAGRNGHIHVTDLDEGSLKLDIAADTARIRALAWSADGSQLLAAGESRSIGIWDTAAGTRIRQLSTPGNKIMSLALCGADLAAVAGSDNIVHVWDLRQQREKLRLVGHTGSVAVVACDPVSETLVSGSFDTTIRVWQLNRGLPDEETARKSAPPKRLR